MTADSQVSCDSTFDTHRPFINTPSIMNTHGTRKKIPALVSTPVEVQLVSLALNAKHPPGEPSQTISLSPAKANRPTDVERSSHANDLYSEYITFAATQQVHKQVNPESISLRSEHTNLRVRNYLISKYQNEQPRKSKYHRLHLQYILPQ